MKQLLGIATTLLLVASVPALAEKPVSTGAVVQVADAEVSTQADQMNSKQDENAKPVAAEKAKKQHKAKKHHKAEKKAEHKKTVKKAKHAKKKVKAKDSEKAKAKNDTANPDEAPK